MESVLKQLDYRYINSSDIVWYVILCYACISDTTNLNSDNFNNGVNWSHQNAVKRTIWIFLMDYFVQKVVTSNLKALLCQVMRMIGGAQAIMIPWGKRGPNHVRVSYQQLGTLKNNFCIIFFKIIVMYLIEQLVMFTIHFKLLKLAS